MRLHPSISVHEVCFPATFSVSDILAWAEENGIGHVGLFSLRRGGDWSGAIKDVAASPVNVAYLSHASMFQLDDPESWPASTARLIATIDAAHAMGTPLVYGTTGPAGRLEFEEAVEALSRAIVPVRAYAEDLGVQLLIETTQPNFCFTHFIHSFQDTVDVAEQVGIGICLDLWPTWHERGIRQRIAAVASRVALIQVADHVPRNTSPSRDIVGTGIIPIERLLRTAFDAGYAGLVDLELFGRPDETAADDLLTSARALSNMLDRIGVIGNQVKSVEEQTGF
jgi:sugar phosphate isomerase/epimerase